MFVGKVDKASFTGVSRVAQQQQETQGLSADFFGQASPMDRMKDMQLSKSLGIDTQGMDRTDIKANILSRLTGKSVEEMKAFYSTVSEQDMKNDMQTLASYGLEASAQPNQMMSRAENKATIANQWIQEANSTNTQTNIQQASESTEDKSAQQAQNTPPSGGSQGPPSEILSILSQLGISSTGSKSGDLATVLSKLSSMETSATSDTEKQSISTMRQNFIAVFSSL